MLAAGRAEEPDCPRSDRGTRGTLAGHALMSCPAAAVTSVVSRLSDEEIELP